MGATGGVNAAAALALAATAAGLQAYQFITSRKQQVRGPWGGSIPLRGGLGPWV